MCSWHLVNNINYIFQITGWADVLIRPRGAFVNGGKNVGFPGSSVVKNLLPMQETQVRSLVQENALAHSVSGPALNFPGSLLWLQSQDHFSCRTSPSWPEQTA